MPSKTPNAHWECHWQNSIMKGNGYHNFLELSAVKVGKKVGFIFILHLIFRRLAGEVCFEPKDNKSEFFTREGDIALV